MSVPFRLFVTDLDGTLLGPDLKVSDASRAALGALSARGCTVAIATGRMLASATPFAAELGVTAPLITYNGAWIRCGQTGTDLWHRGVPGPLAREAAAALEAAGLHVNLYLDDRVHIRVRSPEAEAYLAHARVEPVWCERWEALGDRPTTKILAIGPEARVQQALAELAPRFEGRLWMTQSMPTFLEVALGDVHKGAAVRHLAAHLGIPREQVVAVGDGLNDAEMLEWAGLGVAMGNACEAVRQRADRVTGRVDEDGVAALIEALRAEGRV